MNAIPLPIELINKIINYTGVVTFYNGKYYNKIMKNDKRYTMLESIIKTPHTVNYNNHIIYNYFNYLKK